MVKTRRFKRQISGEKLAQEILVKEGRAAYEKLLLEVHGFSEIEIPVTMPGQTKNNGKRTYRIFSPAENSLLFEGKIHKQKIKNQCFKIKN